MFVGSWTLANGIGVATILWFLAIIDQKLSSFQLTLYWLLAGFGAIAAAQQLLLERYEVRPGSWLPTSYFAVALTFVIGIAAHDFTFALVGSFTQKGQTIEDIGSILAAIIYGACFGALQMLPCPVLRKRPWIWPVASGIAFPSTVLIATQCRFAGSVFVVYAVALLMGAAYGIVTAVALVIALPQLRSDPSDGQTR